MANNIIDDMLKEQIPNKTDKKKKPKILIVFIVLLLIILVLAVVVFFFLKNQQKVTPKDSFIEYLGKTNISNALNFEKVDNLNERMKTEPSESETEITNNSTGLFESDIDLSKIFLTLNSKNNPKNKKFYSDIALKYQDNNIINFNVLSNNDRVGIISEDIVIKYLGSKYSNLIDVLNRAFKDEGFSIPEDISQLNISDVEIPKISNEVFFKYIDVINKNTKEEAFSSKEITLDRSSGKVDVTEYTLSLNESEVIELLDQMLQTLENDDELLRLLVSFDENSEDLKEKLKSEIEKYISYLYQQTPDNSKIYKLKVYGKNNITYKIALDLAGENNIDIDFDNKENENTMTITFLEQKNNNGFSIEMKKTMSDVSENLDLTLNIIQASDIVGKANITSDLVISGNSYTLKNKIDFNIMMMSLNLQTNSEINFKDVEIEDLTNENCVFLDEQDEGNFNDIVEAVKTRTEEVINNNLSKQGLSPIGDGNQVYNSGEGQYIGNPSSNTTDPNTPPDNSTDNTGSDDLGSTDTGEGQALSKEDAKNKIINSVSEAMTIAQNEGREYTLDDLINLEIPGSTVSVAVDGDVATLNVDGFEFKLNSAFQLYE